ncbi:MAG: helix-turn-helix transcriptional regulator [Miniphocaeibacter sp.]|uniref:helix-turn-helix transcriptional regulator n=1 Tax=Miniphocaeibacter sp. TaxID=3100973 RepID=UPI003BAFE8E4
MKNRLKEIREELGLTQGELAEKANLSRYTINQIERGKDSVKSETIKALVMATGIPANKIFFDFDVV